MLVMGAFFLPCAARGIKLAGVLTGRGEAFRPMLCIKMAFLGGFQKTWVNKHFLSIFTQDAKNYILIL